MPHPPRVTRGTFFVFFTIPIALNAAGSMSGQDAVVAVRNVAATISAVVRGAIGCRVFRRCHAIQLQAPTTEAIASHVIQPCA